MVVVWWRVEVADDDGEVRDSASESYLVVSSVLLKHFSTVNIELFRSHASGN